VTVNVVYIEHNGTEHRVAVNQPLSLMQAALVNRVPGIVAACAGDCGCATCHVYVDPAWRAKTGEPSRREISTLRFALDVKPNSRLSCQIQVKDELDGLIVRLPLRQY
jgi:2Fe-2S ferredoxin